MDTDTAAPTPSPDTDVLSAIDAARAKREKVYADLDAANAELNEAIVRAYLNRHTWDTLVERAGLSMPTIRQRLIQAGALVPRTQRDG